MSDFVNLTRDVLDVGAISDQVRTDSTGAVSIFVGTTRDHFEGKKVLRLEYEAYDTMAVAEMKKLCGQLRDKWGGVRHVAISHRTGPVGLREASVVIAVSSEHRKDSLEAVSYAIDQLKKCVPIWKKEVYADESKQWKENKECDWSSANTTSNDNAYEVDPSLVQITASSDEINRRMEAFMARKREELNRNNVLEFCNRVEEDDETGVAREGGNSCARVDSVAPSRGSDRSGHIRHTEVVNAVGPQISNDYMDRSYDPLEHSMKRSRKELEEEGRGDDLPVSIRERVLNLEDKLVDGKPVDKDIYKRLKALEDKVRYLEGLSPEYLNFSKKSDKSSEANSIENAMPSSNSEASLTNINIRIQELQKTLKSGKNIKEETQ